MTARTNADFEEKLHFLCRIWLGSADEWMTFRKLRNQMVHEYIEDRVLLVDALNAGASYVPSLVRIGRRLVSEIESRL